MTAPALPSYSSGTSTVPLLGDTIGANLDRTAARVGEHEALVECASGRRWTYPQLVADVDAFALGLHALGVEKGERVGIWAPNCAELVFVQYGTAKLGVLLQKAGDATYLALDRLSARLGGVRREDGPELQTLQQRHSLAAPALIHEPTIGNREVVDRVCSRGGIDRALALAQRGHAIVLLADVREVKVRDKGSHEESRATLVKPVDGVLELRKGRALIVRLRRLVGVRAEGVGEKHVKGLQKTGVKLVEHLAHQAQEEVHVLGDALGNVKGGHGI